MASSTLPKTVFENILSKLATILELTQRPEGTVTPEAKQALLQATNDFKSTMSQAKELASALPGGELGIGEQNEVIAMLERLGNLKRQQLAQFSTQVLSSTSITVEENQMEIDSMASTPVAQ